MTISKRGKILTGKKLATLIAKRARRVVRRKQTVENATAVRVAKQRPAEYAKAGMLADDSRRAAAITELEAAQATTAKWRQRMINAGELRPAAVTP